MTFNKNFFIEIFFGRKFVNRSPLKKYPNYSYANCSEENNFWVQPFLGVIYYWPFQNK